MIGLATDQLPEMSSGDYYRLLGLSRSASVDDIKAAFRVAAKKYHPDVNRDKGEKAEAEAADHFKLIQAAYATLSNPAERRSYDLTHPRAGRVAQASSAEYEAAGGGASGGYAEWDPKTAARRAAAASSAAGRPFNAGAGFARTAKAPHGFGTGGVDESSEEPYIDYSQWNAAHFGPTAQERERYTAQRVKEAKQTGFSGYNDANASRGANWAHRKAARDRAKEWEEVFGSGDEDSSNTGDASGPAAGGPDRKSVV